LVYAWQSQYVVKECRRRAVALTNAHGLSPAYRARGMASRQTQQLSTTNYYTVEQVGKEDVGWKGRSGGRKHISGVPCLWSAGQKLSEDSPITPPQWELSLAPPTLNQAGCTLPSYRRRTHAVPVLAYRTMMLTLQQWQKSTMLHVGCIEHALALYLCNGKRASF